MHLREQFDLGGRDAPYQVLGFQLRRVLQARCRKHFGQGTQGIVVEVQHPLGFVRHHQRTLAQRVLRGHTGRALVGVAALRLNAADGEHEAARRVGPISANGQHAGNVERADDLAAGAQLDLVAQVQANQGVVHEQQPFAQRYANVVGELHRRRAGAAFLAVDDDEVGQDAGFQHGLGYAHELPRVAQAELETYRFAARQLTQLGNELHHLDGGGEGTVARRRYAVFAHQHTTGFGDFPGHLVLGQDAAMAGLGALAHKLMYYRSVDLGVHDGQKAYQARHW